MGLRLFFMRSEYCDECPLECPINRTNATIVIMIKHVKYTVFCVLHYFLNVKFVEPKNSNFSLTNKCVVTLTSVNLMCHKRLTNFTIENIPRKKYFLLIYY